MIKITMKPHNDSEKKHSRRFTVVEAIDKDGKKLDKAPVGDVYFTRPWCNGREVCIIELED